LACGVFKKRRESYTNLQQKTVLKDELIVTVLRNDGSRESTEKH